MFPSFSIPPCHTEPEAALISEVFTETAKNTFFPSGMHQMIYQVSDFSGKVSPRVDHKIVFVICHSSHIWLPPSPAPPLFFVQKKRQKIPTGRTMFAPDHTLTSSLCVSASFTDTKTFNASLLTTCTWLKSQHTVLWSRSLLQFCFIAVTMDFCPSGLLKATENKGNVLQGTMVLW